MPITEEQIDIAIRAYLKDRAKYESEVAGFAEFIKRKAAEMNTSFREVGDGLKSISHPDVQKRVDDAVKGLEAMGPAANKAGKGIFSLNNVIRTALGTLEAMTIFLLSRFIGEAITKAIDSLKQLELAFYKIGVAERSLSKAGVDITPQDLTAISDEIQSTFAYISKIDSLKMVSNLALLTKDLKLTKEQILDLAKAIPILATNADISIESATQQVINGLTKSGKGWADLGITVDANIIKQEAVKDGLVASADAYDKLTAEQKQQVEVLALIQILNGSVSDGLDDQATYLDTVAGKQRVMGKLWEDFLTQVAELNSPIIKKFFDAMISGLQLLQIVLFGVAGGLSVVSGAFVAFFAILTGRVSNVKQAIDIFKQAQGLSLDTMLSGGNLSPDTTTGDKQKKQEEQNQEDLQKALEKMNKEILEAQIKLAQDMEDAAIDLGRKLTDIATEYAKKRADAERDYKNKVTDINASYRSKINDINNKQAEDNQKAKNDELNREAEFQNKMLELREKYLMALEDALHERDARQVLRLMKQYNLDKTQAERDHALDEQKAARDLSAKRQQYAKERQQAENERKVKLAEAQRDYQDKLAKLKADEDAEKRAAQLAYDRKMQDLQREITNRLALVAAGLVSEFNLTKKGLDAIYQLYMKYFGAVSQIYSSMFTMLSGRLGAIGVSTPAVAASNARAISQGNRPAVVGSGNRYAEGGTMIADKPTTVTFGEAGLEAAQFTPIGRNGRDVNKIFSSLGGGGGSNGNGSVEIGVTLSPDLEGRIVRKSLDETAGVIAKINNSRR